MVFSFACFLCSAAEYTGELAHQRGCQAVGQALPDFAGDLSQKHYVHHGDCVDLDSDTFEAVGRLRMFLFHDLLIVAREQSELGRFRLLDQYEAQRVAVSRVRDRDAVRNVLNLLMPTGSNIYCQYADAETTLEWIKKFAEAARFNADAAAAAATTGRTTTSAQSSAKKSSKKNAAPPPPPTAVAVPPGAAKVTSELALSPTDSMSSANISASPSTVYGPDWLMAAPEEILTMIAQRHFDETLQLITEAEAYMQKEAPFDGAAELAEKVSAERGSSVVGGATIYLPSFLLRSHQTDQTAESQSGHRAAARTVRLAESQLECGAPFGPTTAEAAGRHGQGARSVRHAAARLQHGHSDVTATGASQ